MRRISIPSLAVLGLLAASVLPAAAFNGSIHYHLTDAKGGSHDMTLSTLDGKVRSDLTAAGHAMASIIDLQAKTVTTLMPERKAYHVGSYAAAAAKGGAVSAVKTGKSETIAGYAADEWTVTRNGKTSSVWLTDKLGRGFFQQGGGPATVDVPEEWKGKDLVLLRASRPGGMLMEAVKVDTIAPDAALFSVPSDYTEMKGGPASAAMGSPDAAARMHKAMEGMTPEQRAAMQKYMQAAPGAAQ